MKIKLYLTNIPCLPISLLTVFSAVNKKGLAVIMYVDTEWPYNHSAPCKYHIFLYLK